MLRRTAGFLREFLDDKYWTFCYHFLSKIFCHVELLSCGKFSDAWQRKWLAFNFCHGTYRNTFYVLENIMNIISINILYHFAIQYSNTFTPNVFKYKHSSTISYGFSINIIIMKFTAFLRANIRDKLQERSKHCLEAPRRLFW